MTPGLALEKSMERPCIYNIHTPDSLSVSTLCFLCDLFLSYALAGSTAPGGSLLVLSFPAMGGGEVEDPERVPRGAVLCMVGCGVASLAFAPRRQELPSPQM